jgi:serine/threonine protein kinase
MLCGRPPFESAEVKQTYQKIKSGHFTFPENLDIHPFAKSFVRSCLILDPAKRMNLEEMLEHDFLCWTPLPKQLPVNTLVCPPAENYTV